MATITKKIKLKKVTSVPNKNGSTNFGGITNNGNYIYCCKTNGADSTTTIYRFPKYNAKTYSTKKFLKLNHANGLAYYKGFLYVPTWTKNNAPKGIFKINFKDGSKKLIPGPMVTGSISHVKGDIFMIRSGNAKDHSKFTVATIKVTDSGFNIISRVSVSNPAYKKHNINQDIYYCARNGKLYVPLSASSYRSNAVIVTDLGKIDSTGKFVNEGKTLAPSEVWLIDAPAAGSYEIESLTMDKDGHLLFALNSPSDGIYVKA